MSDIPHDKSAILEESHVFRIGGLRVKLEGDQFVFCKVALDQRDDGPHVTLDRRQTCALIAKLSAMLGNVKG